MYLMTYLRVPGIVTVEPLLRVDQVSDYLGVSTDTLETWRRKGLGPKSIKVGQRHVRYRRADVDRWLDEQASGLAP